MRHYRCNVLSFVVMAFWLWLALMLTNVLVYRLVHALTLLTRGF